MGREATVNRLQQTYLVAVILVAIVIGSFMSIFITRASETKRITIQNCMQTRILIQDLVLRSVNKTHIDWKRDPEGVIVAYRLFLLSFPTYRNDYDLYSSNIRNTKKTLELSDPEECRG